MAAPNLLSSCVEFSWKLYRNVSKSGKNVIISPHSVTTALMLACLGAKGETEHQIRKVLGFSEGTADDTHRAFSKLCVALKNGSCDKSDGTVVTIANKLFAKTGLAVLEKFRSDSSELYASGIEPMDFGSKPSECRVAINKWVEDNTKEKIKDLLKEGDIDVTTNLVLANAIYFKGKWNKPFDTANTEQVDFHISENNTVKVEMMRQKLDIFYVKDDVLNFAAVAVPYQQRSMTMVIIRPTDIEGLSKLEDQMMVDKLSSTIGQLSTGIRSKVDIGLPKFTFAETSDLSRILPEMGISDLFDVSKADLSGMLSAKGIAFTNVVHKAYIEVNEEGTEAAAATAMISRMMMIPAQEVSFICDRPFLFVLCDMENGAVLFIGRFSVPA